MKKSIKNVLSLSAIAAVAMMPFAVNAATNITGEVAATTTYKSDVTLTGDVEVLNGDISTVADTTNPADIVIDLNNHTLTLNNGVVSIANDASKKVVIKNGTIVCKNNGARACVSSSAANLEMTNVNINSKGANALAITGGKTTYASSNNTIVGAVSTTAGTLEVSGTVTGPTSLAAKAVEGAVINANSVATTAANAADAADAEDFTTITKKVTINLNNVDFDKDKVATYFFKIKKDGNATVNYPTSLFELNEKSGSDETYTFKALDIKAWTEAQDKYEDLTADQKQALKDKYSATIVEALFENGHGARPANPTGDVRDQESHNRLVAQLNNILGQKNDVNLGEIQDIIDQNKPAADETINKNPQTSDSIYSVASLALVGISALGVAAKKRFN